MWNICVFDDEWKWLIIVKINCNVIILTFPLKDEEKWEILYRFVDLLLKENYLKIEEKRFDISTVYKSN